MESLQNNFKKMDFVAYAPAKRVIKTKKVNGSRCFVIGERGKAGNLTAINETGCQLPVTGCIGFIEML